MNIINNQEINRAPIIDTNIKTFKIREGYAYKETYSLSKHAIDLDNDEMTFKLVNDYGSGIILSRYGDVIVPVGLKADVYKIDFVVSDGKDDSCVTTFNIAVTKNDIEEENNNAPTALTASGTIELMEGYATNNSINASKHFKDDDGDTIAFLIVDDGNTNTTVDISSGIVTIPEGLKKGKYVVEIEAFDGLEYSSTAKLNIIVK